MLMNPETKASLPVEAKDSKQQVPAVISAHVCLPQAVETEEDATVYSQTVMSSQSPAGGSDLNKLVDGMKCMRLTSSSRSSGGSANSQNKTKLYIAKTEQRADNSDDKPLARHPPGSNPTKYCQVNTIQPTHSRVNAGAKRAGTQYSATTADLNAFDYSQLTAAADTNVNIAKAQKAELPPREPVESFDPSFSYQTSQQASDFSPGQHNFSSSGSPPYVMPPYAVTQPLYHNQLSPVSTASHAAITASPGYSDHPSPPYTTGCQLSSQCVPDYSEACQRTLYGLDSPPYSYAGSSPSALSATSGPASVDDQYLIGCSDFLHSPAESVEKRLATDQLISDTLEVAHKVYGGEPTFNGNELPALPPSVSTQPYLSPRVSDCTIYTPAGAALVTTNGLLPSEASRRAEGRLSYDAFAHYSFNQSASFAPQYPTPVTNASHFYPSVPPTMPPHHPSPQYAPYSTLPGSKLSQNNFPAPLFQPGHPIPTAAAVSVCNGMTATESHSITTTTQPGNRPSYLHTNTALPELPGDLDGILGIADKKPEIKDGKILIEPLKKPQPPNKPEQPISRPLVRVVIIDSTQLIPQPKPTVYPKIQPNPEQAKELIKQSSDAAMVSANGKKRSTTKKGRKPGSKLKKHIPSQVATDFIANCSDERLLNAREDGHTYLTMAIAEGASKREQVLALLEAIPSRPRLRTLLFKRNEHNNQSPLFLAVLTGQTWLVEKLIQAGVDDDQCSFLPGSDGRQRGYTALDYASKFGSRCIDSLRILVKSKRVANSINTPNRDEGMTPLQLAIYYHGDVDPKNRKTPINNMDAIRCLLHHEMIDPNIQDTKSGKTTLHFAVDKGDAELVRLVLNSAVSTDLANYDGRSALHLAASLRKPESVKINICKQLLEKGVSKNAKDKDRKCARDLIPVTENELARLLSDDIGGVISLSPLSTDLPGGY